MFENLLKVKISTSFPQWPLRNQLPKKSLQLGSVTFSIDQPDPECDFWIIFDDLSKPEEAHCSPKNILFVTGEPPSIRYYSKRFLKQFFSVLTCHPNLPHPQIHYGQQGHPWHVGKDYDTVTKDLTTPKTKLLSIISSDKVYSAGHRARLDFARRLKKSFGDQVELFGRGIKTFDTKWEVLAPFKYSVAIENCVLDDWVTEKLPDCWLAECYPFYYGAKNIFKYYQQQSFTPINIHQPNQAIKTIASLLSNTNHYASVLPAIHEAKHRYLDQYSFFPLLSNYAKKLYTHQVIKDAITLKPMRMFSEGWLERQLNLLKLRSASRKL